MLLAALCIISLIYIVSCSFSSPDAVSKGKVVLLPVEVSLKAYEEVFRYGAIVTGFANSTYYTVVGTAVNILMTVAAAYPLSR